MSHYPDKPEYISSDDCVGDADDYLDSMSADSFPASDPPSTTPVAVGTPDRSRRARPDTVRGAGQNATDVTVLRSLVSVGRALGTLGRAHIRALFPRGTARA